MNYMKCVNNTEPIVTNAIDDVTILCPIVKVNDGVVSIEVKTG